MIQEKVHMNRSCAQIENLKTDYALNVTKEYMSFDNFSPVQKYMYQYESTGISLILQHGSSTSHERPAFSAQSS